INIQGRLTDKVSDSPITGAQNMGFYLWDSPSGGSLLGWNETLSGVECDENGIFNAILGSTTPIPDSAFEGDVAYMEIRVQKDGIWSQIFERQRMVAVPYAITARNVRDGVVANAQSVHLAATAPDDMVAEAGKMYYNSETSHLQYSDGSQWISLDPPYTINPIQVVSYKKDVYPWVGWGRPSTSQVALPAPSTDIIIVACSGNFTSGLTGASEQNYTFRIHQGVKQKVSFVVHGSPDGVGGYYNSFPFPIIAKAGTDVSITAQSTTYTGSADHGFDTFALYYIELPLRVEEARLFAH
ncbi:hypothetical protein ACFL37_02655, partial [Candidatus Margulisiibacteriota bacterium]